MGRKRAALTGAPTNKPPRSVVRRRPAAQVGDGVPQALLLLAWTVLEKPGFRDFKDGPSQHQVVPAEESWRADAESHHVRALSPYVVPSGA